MAAAQAYLFWGEEFLVRKDADALVKKLIPEASMGLNCVTMDGATPKELAAELATMPLFPGPKLVLTRDPDFLAPRKGRADGLAKARDAWRSGKRKEGARRLLAVAARAGWGPQDIDPSRTGSPSADAWKAELSIELADVDLGFLKEVAEFCREEKMVAPESDALPLLRLLSLGLPAGHVLVVAATDVDPRHPLVKWLEENGEIRKRKVDSRLKELDVSELARELLAPLGKKLGPGAEQALKDRVGGNMRLLQSELEKLALYAQKPVIDREDEELLVARAREEEYLELSDALQKRDLKGALRYVEDALEQGTAPLMLLGAVTSIVRGLVESQERLRHIAQGRAPRSLDEFKSRVFPTLEAEAKSAGGKAPHPYGAFIGMQAAGRYSRPELRAVWMACADADLALKSSASGKLVLERLVFRMCGTAG